MNPTRTHLVATLLSPVFFSAVLLCLVLGVEAAVGAAIVLETTTDLSAWVEDRRMTGQGPGKPVRLEVIPDPPNARARTLTGWRDE